MLNLAAAVWVCGRTEGVMSSVEQPRPRAAAVVGALVAAAILLGGFVWLAPRGAEPPQTRDQPGGGARGPRCTYAQRSRPADHTRRTPRRLPVPHPIHPRADRCQDYPASPDTPTTPRPGRSVLPANYTLI